MTRINVVDPSHLTDQHLMAEYRELPMVIGTLKRSLKSPKGLPKIGSKYSLNGGHVSFFYDKGKFLFRRYQALIEELKHRHYQLDPNRSPDWSVFELNGLNNDWSPDMEALIVNRNRIRERILQKPHWYKYYAAPITEQPAEVYAELVEPTKIWF